MMLLLFYCSLVQFVHGTYFDEQTLYHLEWPGKLKAPLEGEESVFVTSKNNENYVCYVAKGKTESEAADIRDAFLPSPNEIDLLRPLFDKDVCIHKVHSYWTYELCHGKNLRQFHKDDGVIKVTGGEVTAEPPSGSSFILGNYHEPDWRNSKQLKEKYKASDKPPMYQFSRIELPYFPVQLDPGEMCDLTGQPRNVRVYYFCQPDVKAEFYDIHETSTCNYVVLVFTSYLCDNKKYRPATSAKDVGIKCYINDEKSPSKPVDLAKLTPAPPKYRDIFGKKPAVKIVNKKDQDDADEDEDEFIDDFWIMDQMGLGPVPDLDAEDPFSKAGRKISISKARKALGSAGQAGYMKPPPAPSKPLITDYQHVKDFLRGTYCLHGGMPGGWWRYELCFGHSARQYHEELADDRHGTKRTEVVLGHWRVEKHLNWLKSNPSKRPKKNVEQRRSIQHLYADGDVCDATGLHRQAIIKLTCNPQDLSEAIGISLSEPSTCMYEIDVIAGKWLCSVVRAADDDGIFDLETAIASLTGEAADAALGANEKPTSSGSGITMASGTTTPIPVAQNPPDESISLTTTPSPVTHPTVLDDVPPPSPVVHQHAAASTSTPSPTKAPAPTEKVAKTTTVAPTTKAKTTQIPETKPQQPSQRPAKAEVKAEAQQPVN